MKVSIDGHDRNKTSSPPKIIATSRELGHINPSSDPRTTMLLIHARKEGRMLEGASSRAGSTDFVKWLTQWPFRVSGIPRPVPPSYPRYSPSDTIRAVGWISRWVIVTFSSFPKLPSRVQTQTRFPIKNCSGGRESRIHAYLLALACT